MSAGDVAPDESPGRAADELSRLEGSMVNGDTGASAGRLKDTRGCHDGLACFCRTEEANRDRARVAKEFQIKVMPVLE